MAVALFMMSYAKIYSDVDLLLPIGMSVLQVVQREEGDPQREGQEVVEEEPVAPPKKEAKKGRKAKRKSSGKKSGKQGTNNDAVSRNKHLDRGSVIELLETKAVKAAFGPGNKDEMEYSYPILISFLRNLTDEQWQVIYKGQKKPMTKEQLAKLCKTIVTFITQSTLQILLPALAGVLGVTGFAEDQTDSTKRGGSARSFTAFDQERLELIQEVKYLAKKLYKGGTGAQRLRSLTPSSKSAQHSGTCCHIWTPRGSSLHLSTGEASQSFPSNQDVFCHLHRPIQAIQTVFNAGLIQRFPLIQ
ncbi:uncharacterized protein LOC121556694 isoform X7 [Coregonus clupeaformis]|uniref:uncharacterized protein LOC121556694 isoform X7 n=1 Tax=Coregonus clupeaformis TaxID=59861 RepID=UPI001E1C552C|nr:uncharacterized protein LOC121556694 isoform X7 [Coregonus clupeaformis]